MKRPRRLTREEKILLSRLGHDPEGYMCAGADKQYIHFVSKKQGAPLTVER